MDKNQILKNVGKVAAVYGAIVLVGSIIVVAIEEHSEREFRHEMERKRAE